MTDLPPDVRMRRELEDRILQLGARRRELQDETRTIVKEMVDLIPEAQRAGVSFDGIAKLIGVPRQTLYRWQEVASYRRKQNAL